jgi:hypothetical protein
MKLHQNLPDQGKFDIYPDKGILLSIQGADEAIAVASRSVLRTKPFEAVRKELIQNGFAIWMYGFSTVQVQISMPTLAALWGELGDIVVSEDGTYVDEKFLHFERGTEVIEVWHWFERANSRFRVADFMGASRKEVHHEYC